MIVALVVVYALAAVTIGRMAYEFDVFAAEPARTLDEAVANRKTEIRVCVLVGVFWFLVPVFGLWVHVKTPRA